MVATNYPKPILEFTLKYEGGKSNDPQDPGGRTNQGVTQRTYDAFRKAFGKRDVYDMSDAERNEIYRRGFWNTVGGDGLRSGEDLCVFDFAVNSGPARALTFWKQAGGRGASDMYIIHKICAHRLSFLHALSSWGRFGRGWGRRVAACEALALRMACGQATSPSVLSANAADAKSISDSAGSAAAVVAGVALISPAIADGKSLAVALAMAATGSGVAAFKSWRHGQRADALSEEAAKVAPP
jgi:lysozyme family protein